MITDKYLSHHNCDCSCLHVKDPCRNVMKKFNGVNSVSGVFSDEFQLSDVPNLGDWELRVAIGEQVRSQSSRFKIATFEVQIVALISG